MRFFKVFTLIFLVAILTAPCFAQITPIGVPKVIEYEGTLSKSNGSPYPTGIYEITFDICIDETCTNVIWSETHTVEIGSRNKKDIDGGTSYEASFVVILGTNEDNPDGPLDLHFDQDYYLHISENTGGYSKILQLMSSPYCMRGEFANYAETAYDSNDETYKDVKAIKVSNAFEADNADTVDNIHASATPEANKLLALDNESEFPNEVLKTGHERGLDADTVDKKHYYQIAQEIDDDIAQHTSDLGHLTNEEKQDLTDGGATTLHYHAIDSCSSGNYIRQINSDGTVICEKDENDVLKNVQCPSGQFVVGFDGNGNIICNAFVPSNFPELHTQINRWNSGGPFDTYHHAYAYKENGTWYIKATCGCQAGSCDSGYTQGTHAECGPAQGCYYTYADILNAETANPSLRVCYDNYDACNTVNW